MLIIKWFLLFTSAALFNCSLFFPAYCFWFVFLFLVPLFYAVFYNPPIFSFKEGFLWGVIFFSLHWYNLLTIILERAEGSFRLMAWFALIIYAAFYSGLWFWIARYFTIVTKNRAVCFFLWVAVSFGYFYFIKQLLFWLFGILSGYPLIWPLVPLAYYPGLLSLCFLFKEEGLLFFLICFSALCARGLCKKQYGNFLAAALCLMPFLAGLYFQKNVSTIPCSLSSVGYARPPLKSCLHPLDAAQEIVRALEQCLKTKPEAQIIFMPESTYQFPLNECTDMIDLWSDNVLPEDVCLCLGSHKKEKGFLYNCFYAIKDRRIIYHYVKKKCVPFVEYLSPYWSTISFTKTLFLGKKDGFFPGNGNQPDQNALFFNNIYLMPSICSEFFLNGSLRKQEAITLCIANDSWFNSYMRRLFCLYAQYRAQCEKQPLFYISHYYGLLIKSDGKMISL